MSHDIELMSLLLTFTVTLLLTKNEQKLKLFLLNMMLNFSTKIYLFKTKITAFTKSCSKIKNN